MAAPRSPRDREGIRNAAGLRPAPAPEVAVPPVLQAGAEPDAVPEVRSEPAPAARPARPVRITVDLAADLHGFLRAYAQARDVAAADVVRELIRQMREDGQLSARVTAVRG